MENPSSSRVRIGFAERNATPEMYGMTEAVFITPES